MAKKKPRPTKAAWKAKLKSLRKKLGLTQRQAADMAGIPERTWISWENAQHVPSDLARGMLAKIFPDLS